MTKKLEQRIKAIKQKTFYQDVEIKDMQSSGSDEYITITAYANRFKDSTGNLIIDRDGDSVSPEGMDITDFNKNPIILFNHNRGDIIGKATKVELRADGIYMTMSIYKALNETVYDAVRLGVLKTCSIGFLVEDLKYISDIDCFLITKAKLLENSLVSLPSNMDSIIESVNVGGSMSLSLSAKSADLLVKDMEQENVETSADLLKEVRDALELLKTLLVKDEVNTGTTKEVETVEELVTKEIETKDNIEVQEKSDGVNENTEVASGDNGTEVVIPTITELADSMVVTEDTFNTLLSVTESLQSKLNAFLNENLN